MAVLREPIVRLLFETGEFTSQDTQVTAYALLFYSAGLFAQSGLQIITRVFYSLQDTITPVKVGFAAVLVNLAISLALLKWTSLDIGGLALAVSVASLVQMMILIGALRLKIGAIGGRRILDTVARAAAACAVMAPCTHYTAALAAKYVDLSGGTGRLVQTFSAIAVGIVVYLALSLILKMEEPVFVVNVVKERLRAKRKAAGRAN